METAISEGYRHIDGAYVYMNEEELGSGVHAMIEKGVVKREDLFIVSKVTETSVRHGALMNTSTDSPSLRSCGAPSTSRLW